MISNFTGSGSTHGTTIMDADRSAPMTMMAGLVSLIPVMSIIGSSFVKNLMVLVFRSPEFVTINN